MNKAPMDIEGNWSKIKPNFPCLFATRKKYQNEYNYNFYRLVKYSDSDNNYLAWCDLDGDEIDDYANLDGWEYCILLTGEK